MYTSFNSREYKDQASSPSYDLAPPPPYPVRKLGRRHTGRLRKKDNFLTGEGGGEEPNHTTARILVLYKSFHTL
jgi:hypothetical protein